MTPLTGKNILTAESLELTLNLLHEQEIATREAGNRANQGADRIGGMATQYAGLYQQVAAALSLSTTANAQALTAATVSGHVATSVALPAGAVNGTRYLVESTATVWEMVGGTWTNSNFGLITLAMIGQTISGVINRQGHAYVEAVTGNDATGQIGKADKSFKTIDAALLATAGIPGFVNIHLSIGRHAHVTDEHVRTRSTTTLRDNVRLIGSGRPIPKPDRTGLDETTGTVIDGPFICQRTNFQTQDLMVDSGQEVCSRLWGSNPQEALVFAYYGQPSYLVGEAPRPGHRHTNVGGMCMLPDSPVHASLFENLLNPAISDIYTYYGTHGTVFKCAGGQASRIFGHGHGGESCIIKASPYATCQQLSVAQIHCETLLPPGNTAGAVAVGAGVQLYGGEAGVTLGQVKVIGIIALGTTFALDVIGGDGTAGGGVIADCDIIGIIGINNTVVGVRARGRVIRLGVEGQILSTANGGHGVDTDDALVEGLRLDLAVTAAQGDGMKVGGLRTRILRAVIEGSGGAGIRNSSATTELHVRSLRGNVGGDLVGTAMIDKLGGGAAASPDEAWHLVSTAGEPAYEDGYADNGSTVGARFYKSGQIVRLGGLVRGSSVGVAIFHLPAGYRPDANMRFLATASGTGNTFGFCSIYIDPAGLVAIDQESVSTTNFLSLEGISFRIA